MYKSCELCSREHTHKVSRPRNASRRPAFSRHTCPTGVPPRKRKRRPRHHRVTTVLSTGTFLAPRWQDIIANCMHMHA